MANYIGKVPDGAKEHVILGVNRVVELADITNSPTTDQVLTATGIASASWQTPADAGLSYTLGTPQATTSGTSKTWSSLPAGINRITVMFEAVSITTTNNISEAVIRIGDSGGIETTGYNGMAQRFFSTPSVEGHLYATASGAVFAVNQNAANTLNGVVTLTRMNTSNTWTFHGALHDSTSRLIVTAGEKTLSGELDRIQIVTLSGNNFDAGSANISYEV